MDFHLILLSKPGIDYKSHGQDCEESKEYSSKVLGLANAEHDWDEHFDETNWEGNQLQVS